METIDTINLVVAIVAVIVATAALAWSFINYKLNVSRKMFEPLHKRIEKFLNVDFPYGTNNFVDCRNQCCLKETYDENINLLLVELLKDIKVLKILNSKKYETISKLFQDFDDLCLAFIIRGKLDLHQIEKYDQMIKEIYSSLKFVYNKY